jgi:golgi-specific brefeldin A-resistance guanine nucleotide exchange factor 1
MLRGCVICAAENSEPLQLLQPFLDIITSAEASGPITGAALVSVRKLLHSPVLSHFPSASVARAMHAVVVALGACKFEATNPWHDQAVLTRILQTLEACIACPSGGILSNTDACAVFQAVYRIGFDTQVVQELSGARSGS